MLTLPIPRLTQSIQQPIQKTVTCGTTLTYSQCPVLAIVAFTQPLLIKSFTIPISSNHRFWFPGDPPQPLGPIHTFRSQQELSMHTSPAPHCALLAQLARPSQGVGP